LELVLAALARRKKLKLGRRAEARDGDAGFSAFGVTRTVGAIGGGIARLSRPFGAVMVVEVV